MELCVRHEAALGNALTLRGLARPLLEDTGAFDPVAFARTAIITHATHLAGKAALEMCTERPGGEAWCPICFINVKNPQRIVFDNWVDHAADEALEEDIARQDRLQGAGR